VRTGSPAPQPRPPTARPCWPLFDACARQAWRRPAHSNDIAHHASASSNTSARRRRPALAAHPAPVRSSQWRSATRCAFQRRCTAYPSPHQARSMRPRHASRRSCLRATQTSPALSDGAHERPSTSRHSASPKSSLAGPSFNPRLPARRAHCLAVSVVEIELGGARNPQALAGRGQRQARPALRKSARRPARCAVSSAGRSPQM